MALNGSGDDLYFEGTADFSPARAEIKTLLDQLVQLADQGVASGEALDKGALTAAAGYKALAVDIKVAAEAEDDLALSAERVKQAQAATAVRTAQAGAAPAIADSKVDTASAQAALAQERVVTEELRQQVMLRQQANADELVQQKILIQNGAELDRQNTAQERQAAQAQAYAESQGALYAKYLEQQEAGIQKVADEQSALYDKYLVQQSAGIARIQEEQDAAAKASAAYQQSLIYADYLAQQKEFDSASSVGNLNATRYALYNVAQTTLTIGAAITAVGVGSAIVATKFQNDFADVQRSAELTGDQISSVKTQLLQLSETVPTSFKDITEVATLGAQMGIASDDLGAFTKTIVEFSSTTNVSFQDAATSFGKISNLLGVLPAQYENLGSAIYEVGIKSVATESQVVEMAEKIAGSAAAYGFTAQYVIGLSGALASLAVQPQAAQGAFTHLFESMETAVHTGGTALAAYAAILGKTSAQTAALFKSNPDQFFSDFINGLSKSKDLLASLDSIGEASNVRTVNVLQRLAGNPQLLAAQVGEANTAFAKGTSLADGFATKTATLDAKFKELVNTLGVVANNVGSLLIPAFTLAVSVLEDLFKLFASNTWAAAIIVGLALIVGGFLLFRGVIATAMAALLAFKFVLMQVGQTVNLTGVNLRSLTALMTEVKGLALEDAGSVGVFASALDDAKIAVIGLGKATIVMAAISAALTLITAGANAVQESMKSGLQQATDYFGSIAGFSDAVAKDTEIYKTTGEAVQTYTQTLTGQEIVAGTNADAIQKIGDAQKGVQDATSKTIDVTTKQTVALGKNTAAWLTNKLANDAGIKAIASDPQQIAEFTKLGGNIADYIQAGLKGKAEEYVNDLYTKALNLPKGNPVPVDGSTLITKLGPSASQLYPNLIGSAKATDQLTTSERTAANVQTFLNTKVDDGSAALGKNATATKTATGTNVTATQSVKTLADQVSGLFGQYNDASKFAQSFETLAQGIATGGKSFSAFTTAGQTNLSNLQDTILSTAAYGKDIGLNVNQSLIPLFANLKKQGVDTTTLLQNLAKEPIIYKAGIDVSAIQKGLDSAGIGTGNDAIQTELLSNLMDSGTASAAKYAAAQNNVGSSAGGAAKQVETLSDYVNDLGTAFTEAFNIRFGMQQGLDTITSQWQAIASAQATAAQNLASYNAQMEQLTSERSTLEFQLSVAQAYGDSLRVAAIQASLLQNSSDQSSTQTQINGAKNASSTSLTGNSAGAIANRASILGLVQSYETYAQAIENSTESDKEKQKQLAALKQDFIQQGQQLGFATTDLEKYSAAFTDMGEIINKLPKNVTVTASTDPAQRAIDDFIAANTGGKGISKGISVPINTDYSNAGLAKYARGEALESQIEKLQAFEINNVAGGHPSDALMSSYDAQIAALKNKINSGNYASGGFVPWNRSGSGDNGYGSLPNGSYVGLSGGEPIMSIAARNKYGDQLFKDINALKFKGGGPAPYNVRAFNGGGPAPITLSSASLGALASLLQQPDIYMDGKKVQAVLDGVNAIRGRRAGR